MKNNMIDKIYILIVMIVIIILKDFTQIKNLALAVLLVLLIFGYDFIKKYINKRKED